jgi:hypothetical protein
MKNKILISVLAASLAMNLGVAAMFGLRFIQTRSVIPPNGCSLVSNDDRLYSLLGLSSDQLAAITPLAQKIHEKIGALSNEIHGKRDVMMSLMEQNDVDMAQANQVRRGILELQSTMQQMVFDHILQMKQILNQDQKKRFFQAMRQSVIQQNLPCSQ